MRKLAHRRTLLAGLFVAFSLAVSGATAQTQSQIVRLIIDYGDGSVTTYTDLPWRNGETILDVMILAKTHPHGTVFAYGGSGAKAFLNSIGGVNNQGGGADKKNWQYWVNTTYGDRSFAVWPVRPMDTVIWEFAPYQGKKS